jgi:dipeptidase E
MAATTRTIFAMGGGGFTMEPENPALDEFILTLADKPVPRLLLLPTASGDAERQVTSFRATYGDRPCQATELSLFRLGETGGISLRDLVLRQDVVYVGGGSMRSMLAIWREYGLDAILREAWERGTVLAGLSAGAMCWFAGGVTKSTGIPRPVEGLGLLPHSLTVHADNDRDRLPVYEAAVASDVLPAGWAADDGVGLLFRDDRLERVVTSRPGTRAVRVERTAEGELVRTPILPALLAAAPLADRSVDGDVLEFRRTRHAALRRGAR